MTDYSCKHCGHRYGKLSPRTPADVREFAKMEEVSA